MNPTDSRSADRPGLPFGSESAIAHDLATGVALTLVLLALWSLTHRYRALEGDAELYAVQALARIHPGLSHDVFLESSSQDHYTFFPALYAKFIGLFGLRQAALTLTLVCKVWFFAAAWRVANVLAGSANAYLSTAVLIVAPGVYGAYSVFHYAEDWLTARSLAEALAVTALALHLDGRRYWAILLAGVAMLVHPLMALPAVLLLACLWVPLWVASLGAALGVMLTAGIAGTSVILAPGIPLLSVLDSEWLEMVRERSQFLFLQLWTLDDWCTNARPFLTLLISMLAMSEITVRKLCMVAMLVGASGLAVGLIASLVGPIAILVQGQAWRWVWITSFMSVLMLAPTAVVMWRDRRCGPLCALLLIAAWVLPIVESTLCTTLALTLWTFRTRLRPRVEPYLQMAALIVVSIVLVWIGANVWTAIHSRLPDSGLETDALGFTRKILGLEGLWVILVGGFAHWIRTRKSIAALAATCAGLLAVVLWGCQETLKDTGRNGTPELISEFSDWRARIPASANVFVLPAHNSAAFSWLTLERPSYLTVNQSSGVVFSRSTSLEVRRRSEVLRPLLEPDWRLLSNMQEAHDSDRIDASSGKDSMNHRSKPLTRERLIGLCGDTQLNFVVAQEYVGFDARRHDHSGEWMGWYLYDCAQVMAGVHAREGAL